MIEIIDNWLSDKLSEFLKDCYLYNTPHFYGHTSNPGADQIPFYQNYCPDDALHAYLFYNVSQTINKNLKPVRSYINVQHQHMDGSFHKDDGETTILYMVTQTLDKGIGCLEFEDGEKVDFVQNRLVWFDASRMHRGNAPNTITPRITLAFKTFVEKV